MREYDSARFRCCNRAFDMSRYSHRRQSEPRMIVTAAQVLHGASRHSHRERIRAPRKQHSTENQIRCEPPLTPNGETPRTSHYHQPTYPSVRASTHTQWKSRHPEAKNWRGFVFGASHHSHRTRESSGKDHFLPQSHSRCDRPLTSKGESHHHRTHIPPNYRRPSAAALESG